MDFGIWVEPEMVNPDSDLFRAHPDWVLTADGYDPVLGRHQLVVDLAIAEAFAEILDRMDALFRDHDIAFVKWDMNRDHVHASGAGGRAGTHAQTLALYRLIDTLRDRHPDVRLRSSSGGTRFGLEVIQSNWPFFRAERALFCWSNYVLLQTWGISRRRQVSLA